MLKREKAKKQLIVALSNSIYAPRKKRDKYNYNFPQSKFVDIFC